jgi:hypothetical protein
MSDGRPLHAVVVTWMDGKKETYLANRYAAEDGVLLVADVADSGRLLGCWHVPLANVREYRPVFRDADPG